MTILQTIKLSNEGIIIMGSNSALIVGAATNVAGSGGVSIGHSVNATGIVTLAGGFLTSTNATTFIGNAGVGSVTVSNTSSTISSATVKGIILGNTATGTGTLSISGGLLALTGALNVGNLGKGSVSITGGGLVVTNIPNNAGGTTGFVIDGAVTITNGSSIAVSNVNTIVGNRGAGTLTAQGGTLRIGTGNLFVSRFAGSTGFVCVDGGASILMTTAGATIFLGTLGTGELILSNGTIQTFEAAIGNTGRGTLRIVSGTMDVASGLSVGESAGSTGIVWMTGGAFSATNANQIVGNSGNGQMTVSNGVVQFRRLSVGLLNQGTVTLAGGTNLFTSELIVGFSSTGTLWMTGGRLLTTNGNTTVGQSGLGKMTVSNGTWLATNVIVAAFSGSQGTLTVAGGTNSIYSGMTLGTFGCNATGIVNVTGGRLYVTNSLGNATLDIRSGTFTQSGGLTTIDNIVITNTCGRLIVTGGSLFYLNTNLSPQFDADGDGVPNAIDTDPFDPNNDNDGDGQSNLAEFQSGTNPTNSASFLGITGIAREGNSIRVTWMTAANKTNTLERTAGVAGSFTNNFTGLTNIFTTGTTTNVLDIGAATNVPSFYYRVRHVP